MERLNQKFHNSIAALDTLKAIVKEPFSVIVRDAAIQRFEYTFEAFWKFIHEYLKEEEGIVVNSPKSCFRELFSTGICDEEETIKLLEMTDRRNETSHTYKEEIAQAIYEQIKSFSDLMDKILNKIREKVK
jgi:nucleotidyltransferase substrate binding protein (TIGR01987 family)